MFAVRAEYLKHTKEPRISAKEPYISAETTLCSDRSIRTGGHGTARKVLWGMYIWKALYLHKWALDLCKRALHLRQKCYYVRKRALYSCKRALYVCKRTLYLCTRALYLCKRAQFLRKRALICRRPLIHKCEMTCSYLWYDTSTAINLCVQ